MSNDTDKANINKQKHALQIKSSAVICQKQNTKAN